MLDETQGSVTPCLHGKGTSSLGLLPNNLKDTFAFSLHVPEMDWCKLNWLRFDCNREKCSVQL